MERLKLYLSLFFVMFCAVSFAQRTEYSIAPGYNQLNFTAPEPGTYTLEKYNLASNGNIIDAVGNKQQLHDLFDDKIVLLNFMYTTCTDVNGCPLATAVFHKVRNLLNKDPKLGKQVSLISMSFDPENDSPEVMKLYGYGTDKGVVDWNFLTTSSFEDLEPILDGYGQRILKEYDDDGNYIGSISHILRVFLIDKNKTVRNIYSVSYLHSDVLINDIKTLVDPRTRNGTIESSSLDESSPLEPIFVASDEPLSNSLQTILMASGASLAKPGDYKEGYTSKDYTTQAQPLKRVGKETDLLAIATEKHLGLPKLKTPDGTALTKEKIALGRKMFFDRRLSHTDTISCAICHVPEMGFAHNELRTAVGTEGRSVPRNAPTVLNVGLLARFFHDGRESTLEDQVWGPILNHDEMAIPSPGYLINKIKAIPDYQNQFENAYGSPPNMDNISRAFAAYQYSLLSANSAFDRWYYGNEKDAISYEAQKGFEIFTGKGTCASCHLINDEFALFTDEKLHNTGIGYEASMYVEPPVKKLILAPGVEIDVDTSSYKDDSRFRDEIAPNDLGLYTITQDPNDRWKFRTPPLRNVAITAPYMHNGALSTLREVVEFYNKGGVKNEVLSPLMFPLNLSEKEIDYLVEFLKTLTGSNVDELILDAKAAPIGEISLNDPNWFHENKPKY